MSAQYERERAALQEEARAAQPLITWKEFLAEVLKATAVKGVSVHSIQMGCGAGQSLKHMIANKSFGVPAFNILLLLYKLGYRLYKVKKIRKSKNRRKR
jgi:ABC-type transport system involved in cytochrome bd biosynthesis fused ATPase/permease subunit